MGWSGSTFNRLYSWVTDFQAGGDALYIDAEKMDEEFDEFKEGLEALLLRDGSNSPSANIGWGNNKITNLGAPTASSDAARYNEVLLSLGKYATATFTLSSDTITPTQAIFKIDTESAASTDDVDTITASSFATGSVIIVSAANASRDVVLKDGTGNLENYNDEDITLTDVDQFVMYHYDGTNWEEMWRSRSLEYSQTYTTSSAGTVLTLLSTDATASSGPNLVLRRDSASPAASDLMGTLSFQGDDSGGNATTYAQVGSVLVDPTNTSEDGRLFIQTMIAGTLTQEGYWEGGLVLGSATGAAKGVGTINAAGDIYKNNSAYTNPDYVLEHYFNGKIERFAEKEGADKYEGLIPLDALRDYIERHYRLPGIDDEAAGAFARSDTALLKIEELTLYILELEERIKQLEE